MSRIRTLTNTLPWTEENYVIDTRSQQIAFLQARQLLTQFCPQLQ